MRDDEFASLSQLLEQEFGLARTCFSREKLEKKLANRLRELNIASFGDYLEHFRKDGTFWKEHSFLPAYILNMESYFLREMTQFRLFSELLPAVMAGKSASQNRDVRILSAGCAAGQEPYSIAIVLRESGIAFDGWDLRIVGLDVDTEAIRKAGHGIYHSYALRGVEDRIIDHYFQLIGRDFYRLKPDLLSTVAFRQANLLHPLPFEADYFDFVFCRNVLIYMSDEGAAKIAGNIWKCLSPKGYLFLGQSEAMRRTDRLFVPAKYPDVAVYRKGPA